MHVRRLGRVEGEGCDGGKYGHKQTSKLKVRGGMVGQGGVGL